jgi:hypothetical protein
MKTSVNKQTDTSLVYHKTDTIAGITCWANKKSSILYNNQLDSMEILQFGETYLEITDKKAIWIMCREGQKKLDIMWDRANKKINIMNHSDDSVAIISMIEGNAKIKFKDSIFEIKAPQTMCINYDNTVKIEDHVQDDPIEWTTAKHRTFERIPIYALFNEIARQYNYNVVHLKKCYDVWHVYLEYQATLKETLGDTLYITGEELQYKIQNKTIYIF